MEEVSSRRDVRLTVISVLPTDNSPKVLIRSVMVPANPLIFPDISEIKVPVSLERLEVTLIPPIMPESVWEMFREF